MVKLTQSMLLKVTSVSFKRFRGTFLDKVHVNIQAGNGGMGNQKFGGIGGKGGDVYMQATKAKDLSSVLGQFPERRIKAGHGGKSLEKQLLGLRGKDVIVEVPPGVKAVSDDKLVVGKVDKIDEKVLLARGGIGGNPVTNFSGGRGQKLNVTFKLSLISDVSLLGFPNAGKSTLLKACSRANPRIAAYPFTTVKPNVGILQYEDNRQITMADLPGLIEGAHANYGMGHNFLCHVERTDLVLMIVDVSGFQLSNQYQSRTALETIFLLNKELELYDPNFLDKPMALIINKMDLPGADKIFSEIKDKLSHMEEFTKDLPDNMKSDRFVQFEEIIPVSAKNREGVQSVKEFVRSALENMAEKKRSLTQESEVEESLQKLEARSREKGPILV